MFPLFFMFGGVQGITLTVSTDQTNYNAFVQAGSPTSITNLTVIVNAGVTVKGGSAAQAMDLTGFPTGTTFDIQVSGKIKGRGGRGGSSGIAEYDVVGLCAASSATGQAGGHAIAGDQAISLTVNAGGEVRGGSGGGGAGGGNASGALGRAASGGGGGGGRGQDGGSKGTAGSSNGQAGSDGIAGSDSAGGAGGIGGVHSSITGGNGGAGGEPWAVAGVNGVSAGGVGDGPSCPRARGLGGAAGKAVSLSSGTTTVVDNGTIDGVVD